MGVAPYGTGRPQIRYALYRSYVLFVNAAIEPITEHFPDQLPLGEAQRLGG